MSRPFFNNSIAELEQIFGQRADDPNFRKQLREELSHRTTPRAARLKKRLGALEKPTSTSSYVSPAMQEAASIPVKETLPVEQGLPTGEAKTKSVPENTHAPEENKPAKKRIAVTVPIEPMVLDLPPVTDSSHTYSCPESVLNAWIAMEVLSPATFQKPESLGDGSPYNIVKFSNRLMPWEDGHKRYRKGYRLYYQIILGTISMEPAIDALLKVYTDTRAQRPAARGEAVLEAVVTRLSRI
jgi:hypothetical protein